MKRTQRDELPALYYYIGQRVLQAREAAGLTQADLAERLPFIGRTSLVQIERGLQRIQVEDIYTIAMALDVPIEQLLPKVSKRVLMNTRQAFLEYLGSGEVPAGDIDLPGK